MKDGENCWATQSDRGLKIKLQKYFSLVVFSQIDLSSTCEWKTGVKIWGSLTLLK